jgi:hypothetical protein
MLVSGTPPVRAQSVAPYAQDFLDATFNLDTLTVPAASGAFSAYVARPKGFPSGTEGLGLHYGVALADNVSGKVIRDFAVAALARRQDHYVPLGKGSFWKRVWNAAEYTVIVAPGTSERAINWSGLPGSFAAAALSNAYQPAEQRTWLATLERAGTNTAGYIVGNIWLEFTKAKMQQHPKMARMVKSQ